MSSRAGALSQLFPDGSNNPNSYAIVSRKDDNNVTLESPIGYFKVFYPVSTSGVQNVIIQYACANPGRDIGPSIPHLSVTVSKNGGADWIPMLNQNTRQNCQGNDLILPVDTNQLTPQSEYYGNNLKIALITVQLEPIAYGIKNYRVYSNSGGSIVTYAEVSYNSTAIPNDPGAAFFSIWDGSGNATSQFNFNFRVGCSYRTAMGTNSFYLKWFDADQGEYNQPNTISFTIKNITTGWSQTVSNLNDIGWDGQFRSLQVSFSGNNDLFQWTWNDVYRSNGIQVYMPFSEMHLVSSANCGQPVGFVDDCSLVGTITVIKGWAFDSDNAAGPQVAFNFTGQPQATLTANEPNYRVNEINDFLNAYNYGATARDNAYGFTAYYNNLTPGGSYDLSGTVLNSSPGGVNVGLGRSAVFPGGRVPARCLPTYPPPTCTLTVTSSPRDRNSSTFQSFTIIVRNNSTIGLTVTSATYSANYGVLGGSFGSFSISGGANTSRTSERWGHNTPGIYAITATAATTLGTATCSTTAEIRPAPLSCSFGALPVDPQPSTPMTITSQLSNANNDVRLTVNSYTVSFAGTTRTVNPGTLVNGGQQSQPYSQTYNNVPNGLHTATWNYTATIYGNGQTYTGRASCPSPQITVAELPYSRFYGGDIFAGGNVKNADGSCTPKPGEAIGRMKGGVGSYAGTGVELAAFAMGQVRGVGALSMRPSGQPEYLTFANQAPNVNVSNYQFGGFFNATLCVQDYYANRTTTANTTSPDTININNLNTGRHQYSGNKTLTLPSDLANGKKLVIYVDGDVVLRDPDGKFGYQNSSWTGKQNVPLLYVVASGNIYIDHRIVNLDGVYIAQAGAIYTCSDTTSTARLNYLDESNKARLFNDCGNKLTVNGALLADKVHLLRHKTTVGSADVGANERSTDLDISEAIIYSPDLFFHQSVLNDSKGVKIESLESMPPVL